MSSEEMSRFVMHLMEQLDAIREELKRTNETISSNTWEQQRLNALVLSLTEQLHESRQSNADKDRAIEDLQSLVRVYKKLRFDTPSQKRRRKTAETLGCEDNKGRDDNKGDFDGTADSLNF